MIKTSINASDWIWDKVKYDMRYSFYPFRLFYGGSGIDDNDDFLGYVQGKEDKTAEIIPLATQEHLLEYILDNNYYVVTPCYIVDGEDIRIKNFGLIPKDEYKPITEKEYKERYIHT